MVRDPIKSEDKFPYCFIVSDDPELKEYLEGRRDMVVRVRPVTKWHRGSLRNCFRVTVKMPKHVKMLREDTRIKGEFPGRRHPVLSEVHLRQ